MTTRALPPAPAAIRVRRPADLLGVVPYLLGFYPAEDGVVVLMSARTVRLSLRAGIETLASGRALVELVEDLSDLHGADAVVVLVYTEDRSRAETLLLAVPERLDGVQVLDLIHVRSGRWYSLACRSGCCSPEGEPFDPTTTRTAAEAVYAGLTALPSREELRQRVRPHRSRLAERRACCEEAAQRLLPLPPEQSGRTLALTEELLTGGRPATDRECAELAVAMHDTELRHQVWAAQRRDRAAVSVALWTQVLEFAVDPFRGAPLCQLATAAWLSGDGATMAVCLDELAEIEPGSRLAATIAAINSMGLPPSWWDEAEPTGQG